MRAYALLVVVVTCLGCAAAGPAQGPTKGPSPQEVQKAFELAGCLTQALVPGGEQLAASLLAQGEAGHKALRAAVAGGGLLAQAVGCGLYFQATRQHQAGPASVPASAPQPDCAAAATARDRARCVLSALEREKLVKPPPEEPAPDLRACCARCVAASERDPSGQDVRAVDCRSYALAPPCPTLLAERTVGQCEEAAAGGR